MAKIEVVKVHHQPRRSGPKDAKVPKLKKEGARSKQVDPEIVRLSKLIFAEDHVGSPEEEAQIAQAVKVRAADLRRYLEDRWDKHKETFDWEEFWQAHPEVPEDLHPYFSGDKKITRNPPTGSGAKEKWELLRKRYEDATAQVSAKRLFSRLQEHGVPKELWRFALDPTSIPASDEGDAVRKQLTQLTSAQGNPFQLPLAPNYIDPYFRDRTAPEDLPAMPKELQTALDERAATVSYGLLKFVHAIREASDPEKPTIRNEQTRAFTELFAASLLVRAFRENPSERDSRQYENALWALAASGILKIKFPGDRSSEPDADIASNDPVPSNAGGAVQFEFNAQSLALFAHHVEAYVASRTAEDLKAKIGTTVEEERAAAESAYAEFIASEQYRHTQNFLTSQARKSGVTVSKYRTVIESVGNRLYVTESQLPIEPSAIETRLQKVKERDTDEEAYIDEQNAAVQRALSILRGSRSKIAGEHLTGLTKLASHIALAHGRFAEAESNLQAIDMYVNDTYAESKEAGWAAVGADGTLEKVLESLRHARTALDGKIDRMQGWYDRELTSTEGWEPVATVLADMLEDAGATRTEGLQVWSKAIAMAHKAGLNAGHSVFNLPQEATVVLNENEGPLRTLSQLVETIEGELGTEILTLAEQDDIDPELRTALREAQDALATDNEQLAAKATETLLKHLT